MPIALVTDGLWRKSLSAIRSLGKAGYDVHVLGESVWTTGFWSRFTRRRVRAPVAASDSSAFGEALWSAVRACPEPPVLLPMEDASLRWLSANRTEMAAAARFLIAPADALITAWDKVATMRVAERLGLPCPRTWEPATPAELAATVRGLPPGGFVVKPRSGSGSAGVFYNDGDWLDRWQRHGPLLVQERVPSEGRGVGVSVLMSARGECVAEFAHERLRQYPVSGGPSTDRQSIHAPELVEMSLRLLRELKWVGIAMVEWKIDPRDGRPRLMEINPRFWGSLELAVRAGVDFPALYARECLTGSPSGGVRPPAYPAGVRCRWVVPGDLLRFASDPARESLWKFLRGLPRLAEEWDPRDVRGFVATVVCTAALALHPSYWRYLRR